MTTFRRISKSATAQIARAIRLFRRHWINLTYVNVKLDQGVEVYENVKIEVSDGGFLHVKSNTSICSGAIITVQFGKLHIGKNVFIGTGVVIVAIESISIGDDSLVAEYVVIRDQCHRYDTNPIKDAGFNTGQISIGQNVWIGCKATILRGVSIGDHSVVGAHAVVNKDVPSKVIVAGVPAKLIKRIP